MRDDTRSIPDDFDRRWVVVLPEEDAGGREGRVMRSNSMSKLLSPIRRMTGKSGN